MSPPPQIGPYRIVKAIAEGGMGSVFEAIQEPIGRRVALKVLLPQHAQNRDAVSRFFNEARAVNLIEHPSIVQVSDYGHAPDGTAYLVMELLRGEVLSSRLESLHGAGQRLPAVTAAQIAAQLADALAAAHDKGIIHRDLKPSNVMLVLDSAVPGGSRAKILDFGIAKLMHGHGQHTSTQAIMGTPQYMSPEQCAGSGGVDDRTDVYALGVLLYEMLAGQPPFRAETPLEYMGQHAFVAPPPLAPLAPLAPPELVALVHRLLIKDKRNRPSMSTVGTELRLMVSTGTDSHPALTMLPANTRPALDNYLASRQLTRRGPPSTLGSSSGQTLSRHWGPQRKRAMAIAAAAMILCAWLLHMRFLAGPAPTITMPATTAMRTGTFERSGKPASPAVPVIAAGQPTQTAEVTLRATLPAMVATPAATGTIQARSAGTPSPTPRPTADPASGKPAPEPPPPAVPPTAKPAMATGLGASASSMSQRNSPAPTRGAVKRPVKYVD